MEIQPTLHTQFAETVGKRGYVLFSDLEPEEQATLWTGLIDHKHATPEQKDRINDPGWMVIDKRLGHSPIFSGLHTPEFPSGETYNPYTQPFSFDTNRATAAVILKLNDENQVETIANFICMPKSQFGPAENVLEVNCETGDLIVVSPYADADFVVHGGWLYTANRSPKDEDVSRLKDPTDIFMLKPLMNLLRKHAPKDAKVVFASYPSGYHTRAMGNLMAAASNDTGKVISYNDPRHPDQMDHRGKSLMAIAQMSPKDQAAAQFTWGIMTQVLGAQVLEPTSDYSVYLQPFSAGPVTYLELQ